MVIRRQLDAGRVMIFPFRQPRTPARRGWQQVERALRQGSPERNRRAQEAQKSAVGNSQARLSRKLQIVVVFEHSHHLIVGYLNQY